MLVIGHVDAIGSCLSAYIYLIFEVGATNGKAELAVDV